MKTILYQENRKNSFEVDCTINYFSTKGLLALRYFILTNLLEVSSFEEEEKSTNILNTYLNFIESKLDPYLCGDEITAADYYFFMIIGWYEELENLNCYPKISEIINIMSKNQTIINVKNKQNEREKE